MCWGARDRILSMLVSNKYKNKEGSDEGKGYEAISTEVKDRIGIGSKSQSPGCLRVKWWRIERAHGEQGSA